MAGLHIGLCLFENGDPRYTCPGSQASDPPLRLLLLLLEVVGTLSGCGKPPLGIHSKLGHVHPSHPAVSLPPAAHHLSLLVLTFHYLGHLLVPLWPCHPVPRIRESRLRSVPPARLPLPCRCHALRHHLPHLTRPWPPPVCRKLRARPPYVSGGSGGGGAAWPKA